MAKAPNPSGSNTTTPTNRLSGSTVRTTHRGGTKFGRIPGFRQMREYPLTRGEIFDLALRGGFATLFFSIASFCIGMWVDVNIELTFAQELSPEIQAQWDVTQRFLLYGGIGSALIGLMFTALGVWKVWSIVLGTQHAS